MMRRYEPHLLREHSNIIENLKHGLPFADDKTINHRIMLRFKNYELLYDSDCDNRDLLEDTIARWSDYFKQLAKLQGWSSTYKVLNGEFTYNPIENYDRKEDWTDKASGEKNSESNYKANSSSQTEQENFASGYNTDAQTPVDKSTATGANGINSDNTLKENNSDNSIHNGRIHGNIGVTTTSAMIVAERNMIMNLISDYVDKFADCFNLTM